MSQRPGDFGEVLNEPPIKPGMTKETSYTFNVLGARHLFNSINFSFVNFNTSFRNFMSQDNAFINHKVVLLPIHDNISVFTSLQNRSRLLKQSSKKFHKRRNHP